MPTRRPEYNVSKLSSYNYIAANGPGDNEDLDPYHYGASLISAIQATAGQEVASHTYSHYYCNESGQTNDDFRCDLQAAKQAAHAHGVKLRSLVFARNQYNQDYLKICYDEGIEVVRTNPTDWFWNIESTQNESRWLRFSRGLDAYVPSGDKKTFKRKDLKTEEGVLLIPASRLLRPWSKEYPILNKLRLQRIKKEMLQAARDGECYHLWWHPHNFGNYPEENLKDLEEILMYFKVMEDRYGMLTLNMGEFSNMVEHLNKHYSNKS